MNLAVSYKQKQSNVKIKHETSFSMKNDPRSGPEKINIKHLNQLIINQLGSIGSHAVIDKMVGFMLREDKV